MVSYPLLTLDGAGVSGFSPIIFSAGLGFSEIDFGLFIKALLLKSLRRPFARPAKDLAADGRGLGRPINLMPLTIDESISGIPQGNQRFVFVAGG